MVSPSGQTTNTHYNKNYEKYDHKIPSLFFIVPELLDVDMKYHLIVDRDYPESLCGKRVSRTVCTTVKDFEDFGFDGQIKDLCQVCQDKFDASCNLFKNATEQCAVDDRAKSNGEAK